MIYTTAKKRYFEVKKFKAWELKITSETERLFYIGKIFSNFRQIKPHEFISVFYRVISDYEKRVNVVPMLYLVRNFVLKCRL